MPVPAPPLSALISDIWRSTPAGVHAGGLVTIPQGSAAPNASFDDGFPIETMGPGATAFPRGEDMNGILQQLTRLLKWANMGGQWPFNATLATAIGGYPAGAVLQLNDRATMVMSAIDNNTQDPNLAMSGWIILKPSLPRAFLQTTLTSPIVIAGGMAPGGNMLGSAVGQGTFTPTATGQALVLGSGSVMNMTYANGVTILGTRYGPGSPPAFNAATAGLPTQGGLSQVCPNVLNSQDQFATIGIVTGLVLGTPYWFDFNVICAPGTEIQTNLITVMEF